MSKEEREQMAKMGLLSLLLGDFDLEDLLSNPDEEETEAPAEEMSLLEQYKRLGTPEEIKERIARLESLVERSVVFMDELRAYRATGYTPDEIKSNRQTIAEFVKSLR